MAQFNGRLATVVVGIAALFGMQHVAQAAPLDKVRLIVAFKDGASSQARSLIAQHQGRVVLEVGELDAVAVELPRVVAAKLRQELTQRGHARFVEDDPDRYAFGLADPSGPPYQTGQLVPYGIKMVQADQLPDTNTANRTVCIIDSGIDGAHEDLSGNALSGENLTTSGSWNTDEVHHGSHVAGTIAAIDQTGVGVVGVNPHKKLNIRIEKVFGATGSASASVITKAMIGCGKNGANVVSMSLGGSGASKLEQAAANWLDKKGILVIAAAGNAGNDTVSYPAGFESVVSVAALDVNKAWATFSQFNADVEIAAPGVDVLSTVPMGTGLSATTTVGGTPFSVNVIDGSPVANVTAPLYNYGTGETADPGAAGKVCLIQRGNISFADKVLHCQADGGVGAIIYNNAPGNFSGTLNGTATTIPSVSASDTDGATMLTKLGQATNVKVAASNYAYFNGTSMATPHVSAVAALVWSYFPNCTHKQIRDSLNKSAMELGDPGRDVKFGYGLVQAKAAHDRIASLGCGN